MTIASGWVGSSAVAETGQRWVSDAGPVVLLGASLWMSTLVGKSMGAKLVVAQKQTATLPPGVNGPNPFPVISSGFSSANAFGSISGSYNGRQITGLWSTNLGDITLTLSGAMSGSVRVSLAGVGTWTLTYNSSKGGFYYSVGGTTSVLSGHVGQTIQVTF